MSSESPPAVQVPAHAPFKRRSRIVVVLLSALVLVGIVPLATISWKLIQINRLSLSTAQQEYQLLLASSVAHELDLQVESLRGQLEHVAKTMSAAVRRRGDIPRDGIRKVLGEVTDDRMHYIRYTYFEKGVVRSVSAGDHPEHLEPLFKASLQHAAGAHADGTGGEARAILSDPFLVDEDSRESVLVVAAPVLASGTFRGVLTALVDLTEVWQGVVERKPTGHVLFGLDEGGNVFATSSPVQVKPGDDVGRSPLVRRFLEAQGTSETLTMPFTLQRHGEEQRYIGAFEATRQGWGIFVQARDEQVYWTIGEMKRRTLTWMMALFGLAGLAAIILSRSLSNPVNRLAEASRALASGDLSTRVDVRSSNEIGELAHTFNSMASDIEAYVQQLKHAFEENNELFLGTIRALAQAIDAKDPYTQGHSVRVNRYSVILARQLGLRDADLRDIHVSSLLHDVGKIGIDDAILRKNCALTDEEFEIIKTHTTRGEEIMKPIRQMKNMLPGLRWHHERLNGRGYPDGLKADQIPLMARIIAVADTFDAITTNRPYQHKMTFEAAVARVNELKGDALDVRVVEAFNRACNAGLIRLERQDEEALSEPVPDLPVAETPVAPAPSSVV